MKMSISETTIIIIINTKIIRIWQCFDYKISISNQNGFLLLILWKWCDFYRNCKLFSLSLFLVFFCFLDEFISLVRSFYIKFRIRLSHINFLANDYYQPIYFRSLQIIFSTKKIKQISKFNFRLLIEVGNVCVPKAEFYFAPNLL